MIELAIGFGLGFLSASLLIVIAAPLIHERAVRLTTRQLLATIPTSLVEMQANKDLLRAQFAVSVYRLETRLERMRTRDTAHLAEIGRKAAEISRLKTELGKQSSLIPALEARERVRESIARRAVALLLAFARRHRRKARLMPDRRGELQRVDAPPLQDILNEPSFLNEPSLPQTGPLRDGVAGLQLVQPDGTPKPQSCLDERDAPTDDNAAVHRTVVAVAAVVAMATSASLQRPLN